MSVEIQRDAEQGVVVCRASGKLTKEDYEKFAPEVEQVIKAHGKIRLLFEMHDFHGWDAGAVWEDCKFSLHHFTHIERVAMVGDKKWEQYMAAFCRPFTTSAIHYFDVSRTEEARQWLTAG